MSTATQPDDDGYSVASITAQALNDYDKTAWLLRNMAIWLDNRRGGMDEDWQAMVFGLRAELDKLENRQKTYCNLIQSMTEGGK